MTTLMLEARTGLEGVPRRPFTTRYRRALVIASAAALARRECRIKSGHGAPYLRSVSTPAIMRLTSRASKGRRSPICSPTPMAWIGSA